MTDTATDFIESFDSRAWAAAFVATVKAHPAIATDEATMTGWFANALMRGYDEHAVRANGGGRIIHNGDHLASLLGETEETREPSMTADDPTCDPTPARAEPLPCPFCGEMPDQHTVAGYVFHRGNTMACPLGTVTVDLAQ